MRRPTIRDLAAAAGVSIATVNRIISGHGGVKPATMERVRLAAEQIGFYGIGAIGSRIAASRRRYRLGFLLHQPNRPYYKLMAQEIRFAAEQFADFVVQPVIEFVDDLSPSNIASKLLALGETCEAVSIVAPVHPLIAQAVEALQERGIPVFAMLSAVEARNPVHFVGVDPWKVGRTAAWAVHHMCARPGELGILIGNHRYRCQEMNESGYRSYFREYAREFTLLEPVSTFESAAIAEEMTEKMLRDRPDLKAIFVAGGGISGALAGMRSSGRAGEVLLIGFEMMDVTRQGLIDGVMTLAIATPTAEMARISIAGMVRAIHEQDRQANYSSVLKFDLYTRENI